MMGLLSTHWEGEHQGHKIAVGRNELTKGFSIEWDGQEIARRTWSWIGLGELHGTTELDGKNVEVRVVLEWGGVRLNGNCTVTVDGAAVPMTFIK